MKGLKFILTGALFGIILTKAEVISWYRIYEMFRFQSFHMYGIIGSAVVLGIIIVWTIKKFGIKSISGEDIVFTPKNKSIPRYLYGGIIFGMGWALLGACPGPLFILLGHGFGILIVPIFMALLGTFVYGILRNRLPH